MHINGSNGAKPEQHRIQMNFAHMGHQLYEAFFEHKETAGRFLVAKIQQISFLETITLGAP